MGKVFKYFFFASLSFLNVKEGTCQLKKYTLEGYVKGIDSGKIYLVPIANDRSYYGDNTFMDSSMIDNQRFSMPFRNLDNNAYAYYIRIVSSTKNGETGMLILEPRSQFISIDSLDEYIAPDISHSDSQNELKKNYEPFFRSVIIKTQLLNMESNELDRKYNGDVPEFEIDKWMAELRNISKESDSLFFQFAEKASNPNVVFWKLVERFTISGYKDIYDSIFNMLPSKYMSLNHGRQLQRNLSSANALGIQKTFPHLPLKDMSGKEYLFAPDSFGSDFIFIDFWFHSCLPCIRQFPKLRDIYSKVRLNQLKVVAISVDDLRYFQDLQKVIKQKDIPWVNLWDPSGRVSTKLAIHVFPTNFLLDGKGKIIRKNISLEELDEFLLNETAKKTYDKVDKEPK